MTFARSLDRPFFLLTALLGLQTVAWSQGKDGADWWSFQPLQKVKAPQVKNAKWPVNDIDRFILHKLEAQKMKPAPAATKRVLIRRVTFDLTGLPPTPEEIAAFLADDSAGAFAKVVEQLLASRHYGERWGRHWLDVVRYADTAGCNSDFPMPEAYRYRNYVIDSFNKDKPFDQFIREQIAGDLLTHKSEAERREHLIATGYLAISRRFSSLAEEFHLTLDDTIDNVGKAIFGLTLSCARCHEHKFDPVPQEDYFALYGIFESTQFAFPGTEIYRHTNNLTPLFAEGKTPPEIQKSLDRMAVLDPEILRVRTIHDQLDRGKEKTRLRSEQTKMQKERDQLVKKLPKFEKAYGAFEGEVANAVLHVKGDPEVPGAEIPRGFLQVLGGQVLKPDQKGSGRLELSGWMTDPKNPLTARVMVNRIWQQHFGKGLVRTPNDFGTRGAKPTHPELLDFLTAEFIASGWSIKSLHRWILQSSAYQMAAIENADFRESDPDNQWLWTFNRRRLDAEEIRDAMLAISGALDRSVGGEHPFQPEWKWRYSQHRPFVDDFQTRQRSVYLMQQRIRQQPFLGTFDGADTNISTGRRTISTTPQQALFLMNNKFAHEMAAELFTLLQKNTDQTKRLEQAYELTLGRFPTAEETADSAAYLEQVAKMATSAEAWPSFLRVLMSSNEFVFVD